MGDAESRQVLGRGKRGASRANLMSTWTPAAARQRSFAESWCVFAPLVEARAASTASLGRASFGLACSKIESTFLRLSPRRLQRREGLSHGAGRDSHEHLTSVEGSGQLGEVDGAQAAVICELAQAGTQPRARHRARWPHGALGAGRAATASRRPSAGPLPPAVGRRVAGTASRQATNPRPPLRAGPTLSRFAAAIRHRGDEPKPGGRSPFL